MKNVFKTALVLCLAFIATVDVVEANANQCDSTCEAHGHFRCQR